MTNVYIPNKSGNVYTAAEQFGELIYVSEGKVALAEVNNLYLDTIEALRDSSPDDYIVMAGPYSLVAIICAVFARKHGRLNPLIYRDGEYIRRELDMTGVQDDS